MKHSRFILILTVIAFAAVPASTALAGQGGRDGCPGYGLNGKGFDGHGRGHGQRRGKRDKGMDGMLYAKTHFLLKHQDELGLSEDQVKQIKKLKLSTKKAVIAKEAEIDIVTVDLHAVLWEESPDAAAVRSLVSKKYDLKKEKALTVTDAFLQLKTVLTAEQKEKAKAVWKKKRDGQRKFRQMPSAMPEPMNDE
ncbi:MAG: Spy/CpxP family protein refolding chaperone [Candidatus Omnitrophica bacterium]|nr:Spy/CpxP family protein refolding chaperone [Candidatus Omnitrophota bacterium]